MKAKLLFCLILPLLCIAADEPRKNSGSAPAKNSGESGDKKTEAAPPAKEQPAPRAVKPDNGRPPGVPATAVQIGPNQWTNVEADGKTWNYWLTPFGIQKAPVTLRVGSEDLPPGMIAFDDGENVRFERPSPFGYLKWTKKKTEEMNEVEQRVWERDRKAPAQPRAEPEKKQENK